MEVFRQLNGAAVTLTELSRAQVTNQTIERVFTLVKNRLENTRESPACALKSGKA